MSITPLISICIPAYKKVEYLKRLLDSIAIQTFKDFEVIISDDSDDESVKGVASDYVSKFRMTYLKNDVPLGTPANWNYCISKASGQWIKLIHHDDWLSDKNSLQEFYNSIKNNPTCQFFFSAYNNVFAESGKTESVHLSTWQRILLQKNPLNLFKKNFIGNPSCTVIRKDPDILYDPDFKWVVDFEFYVRYLKKNRQYHYIDKTLINVGMHPGQVTAVSFRKPDVEIPENHLMLQKRGSGILKNIFVYDYYWRLYRNLGISCLSDIEQYYHQDIPTALKNMLKFQRKFPATILKIGIISKILMTFSFMQNILSTKEK